MSRILTVRSALELEVFQRTEVRVLAGAQHLDRPVRWVHTGEIPDIHRFLSGGEMLLTAGLGMGSTAEEQRGFIRRIAEARAAVLVVELAGRMFTTMPAAAIETAEELGLPLVGLSEEVPFVEASAQVHEMLVEMRVAELVAEEATGQAFMDLLLAGEDYLGLTAELARRTGRPVVLENVNHHILAYSGATADADRITGEWGVHSRTMHERHTTPADPVRRVPTARAGSFREVAACARRPVVLRGESWGWLHLLHGEVTPSRADLNALDRASAAIAITLLSEREHGARAAKREGALINRLLLEDISGEDFISRALGIGHDLRERSLVIAVAGRDGDAGSATETLAGLLQEAGLPAVVGDIGDFDLAVIGLSDRTTDRDLVALLEGGGIWGGLSRPVEPSGLVTAIRQGRSAATAAAVAGRQGSGPGTVLRFDDLGVLRLLVAVAEGPELAQYVEDELGELLHHDASSANPLLPTLRAFLDQGANKSRAADVLFVQRRTLYYRLERIGAILGLDLEDLDVRQRLQLALRGHDLLRRPLSGR